MPEPVDEVILVEADPAWAEEARHALTRARIRSRHIASEEHTDLVAIVVAESDLDRAIDAIGEAMDEPPTLFAAPEDDFTQDVPSEGPPPEAEIDDPVPDLTPDPPARQPQGTPDPDQASLCPACGGAYRAGFDLCAECGVPLVPIDQD